MKYRVRLFIVYLLLGVAAIFLYNHETIAVPVNKPLSEIPVRLGSWAMESQERFDPDVIAVLEPTDYLYRTYKGAGRAKATLYLGYHDGGPDSGPIHSPKHCLPGSGWFKLSEEKRTIRIGNVDLPFIQAIYQNDHRKEMFVYFFLVMGKALADEYSLKFSEVANSILYNRRDSAFVRISMPFLEDQAKTESMTMNFLTTLYPYIESALPL